MQKWKRKARRAGWVGKNGKEEMRDGEREKRWRKKGEMEKEEEGRRKGGRGERWWKR